jgi:hypothetical protein
MTTGMILAEPGPLEPVDDREVVKQNLIGHHVFQLKRLDRNILRRCHLFIEVSSA